ncbi:hypothetical protein [Amaricoccus tamworthensis]|uniref:hypothetical protein n=1 Tax=Amaricoccus tamworthensis TaxID=57002 RepID=UPI003C7D50FF
MSVVTWIAGAGVAVMLLPGMALADGVSDMCRERDDEAVCACASERLLAEVGDEDYGLYEAIGATYMTRMAAGEGRSEAWTAASQEVAAARGIEGSTISRTNDIGRAHRDAIKACGG